VKLVLKLALAALIANTIYRLGHEYLTYIKFRDAVRDAAMFRSKDDNELRARISEIAGEYEIPQHIESLDIARVDRHVIVRGMYTKGIEVVPSYWYPWTFLWDVDVMAPSIVASPH
jgi:hypothetical protein